MHTLTQPSFWAGVIVAVVASYFWRMYQAKKQG